MGNANSGRRKPVALKIYEGSPRAKPQDLAAEPAFRPGIEECPSWLPLLAQEYWRHILPELMYVPGLLQRVDRAVLEQVCVAYHRWRTYEQHLLEHGAIYRVQAPYTEGGQEGHWIWKASPETKLAKEASFELARLRNELGLSPVARSRIHSEPLRSAKGLLDTDAV